MRRNTPYGSMSLKNKGRDQSQRLLGEGMLFGFVIFATLSTRAPTIRVKGHLLGLPCGLGACKAVSVEKRALMEREDTIGLVNVSAMSNKQKDEDPLPFLRTPSNRFGSGFDMPTPKKRAASTPGPMDKIFQQEKRDEVDLTIAFFFYHC
jgi:hypothetical protein